MERLSTSKRKRRRDALEEVAWAATRLAWVQGRDDEEAVVLYAYALSFAKARAQTEGCTPEQVTIALERGGLSDPEREQKRQEEREQIAAGLPEDLAAIIRNGGGGR